MKLFSAVSVERRDSRKKKKDPGNMVLNAATLNGRRALRGREQVASTAEGGRFLASRRDLEQGHVVRGLLVDTRPIGSVSNEASSIGPTDRPESTFQESRDKGVKVLMARRRAGINYSPLEQIMHSHHLCVILPIFRHGLFRRTRYAIRTPRQLSSNTLLGLFANRG